MSDYTLPAVMQSLEDEAVTASIPSLNTSRTSPAGVLATGDAGKPNAGHKAETGMLSEPTACSQPFVF